MKTIILTPYSDINNKDYSSETKFIINRTSFEGIGFRLGTKATFTFTHCKFNELEIENEEEVDFRNISIYFDSCFIEKLIITSLVTPNFSIFLENCILSATISNNKIKSVGLKNCILNGNVLLVNIKNASLLYDEESILPIKWRKLFKISNTDFNSLLEKSQNYFANNVENLTFSFSEQIEKARGIYKKPYIRSKENKYRYYPPDSEKKKFLICLNINFETEKNHKVTRVINAKLASLSLQGYSKGRIEVENCRIDNIQLAGLSCEESSSLYNIKPYRNGCNENKFEVKNSNLDKIWFDNVSFNKYSVISFYRNKFGETSITSCEFPEKNEDFVKMITVENIDLPEKRDENYNKLRYEVFLQFKKKLEEQGNFYEAQKLNSVAKETLMDIDTLSTPDKFILCMNSISNKHGLSIINPFIGVIFSGLIFYVFYLASIGRIFNCNDIDYNLIGYYFKFLDITHRSDFLVSKSELNGFSVAIDYLGKLVISFFIYQFIAAFRKYGKG